MSFLEAIVLGIIQGLTEFIPVSSSGHLILAQEAFGAEESTLAFDVALHVGTLIALILYFRKDIWNLAKNVFKSNSEGKLARLIIYSTIPAALAGFIFGGFIDDNARTPLVVACALAVVGILMLISERYASSSVSKNDTPSTKQGLTVGFAQALALIPGVSRSGVTMTTGFFVGLGREQAAKFSFLLSIPIISGSAIGILVLDNAQITVDGVLIAGVLAAFLSGLFAIKFMLGIIGKVGLKPFAYYRLALALLTVVFILV